MTPLMKKFVNQLLDMFSMFEKVNLYEVSIIFTSDIYVSDLKKSFFKRPMDRCYCISVA